jgi:hypothetical protein
MMEYDLVSFVATSNSNIYTHWYLVRRYGMGSIWDINVELYLMSKLIRS